MTSNTLLRCVVMFSLAGAALVGCGGKTATPATTTTTPAPTTAECTPDECAAVAEPPISPMACGEGHDKDIGTACKRVEGACQKVLQCAGAEPTAPAAAPAPAP